MKNLMALLFASMLSVSLVGCNDGPAEDMGEKIDKNLEDAGDAIEDTCEKATDKNC